MVVPGREEGISQIHLMSDWRVLGDLGVWLSMPALVSLFRKVVVPPHDERSQFCCASS